MVFYTSERLAWSFYSQSIGDNVSLNGVDAAGRVRQHVHWSGRDGTPMDNTYPPDAWKRLGKRLQDRRGQLGYGFRQRRRFLEDRGGPGAPSDKMLSRIENGARADYPDETIAALERLYDCKPGSFEAILRDEEPVLESAGNGRPPNSGMAEAGAPRATASSGGKAEHAIELLMQLLDPAKPELAEALQREGNALDAVTIRLLIEETDPNRPKMRRLFQAIMDQEDGNDQFEPLPDRADLLITAAERMLGITPAAAGERLNGTTGTPA